MGITFTLDLEDHRADPGDEPRHVAATHAVLEFLAERQIRGTFFVVGDVAEHEPALVRDVAAEGHEVGVHSFRHRPLTDVAPEEFRAGIRETTARLEDLAQSPVIGFRAPMFSLVASTRWALDTLGELGFTYSSSVLPTHHPLFGDPGCPAVPFRWPNGLLELPCPVARIEGRGLAYLAAVWLRNLPWAITRTALALADEAPLLWSYAHPYDFDPGEAYRKLPEAGAVGSRIIWRGRARMFGRFDRLLAGRGAPPLAERLAALPLATLEGAA
jgi:polysaccharide deacetylase family protein (PEP-CTERM system associated)